MLGSFSGEERAPWGRNIMDTMVGQNMLSLTQHASYTRKTTP